LHANFAVNTTHSFYNPLSLVMTITALSHETIADSKFVALPGLEQQQQNHGRRSAENRGGATVAKISGLVAWDNPKGFYQRYILLCSPPLLFQINRNNNPVGTCTKHHGLLLTVVLWFTGAIHL
jgi:hypothetical protein